VSQGTVDIAFITVAKYQKNIKTIPAIEEDFVFACNISSVYPETVSPAHLKPDKALILSHAPETDPWFDYWFGQSSNALFLLDDMVLLKSILTSGDYWTVIPASVAHSWKDDSQIVFRELKDAPASRTTYYLESPYSNHQMNCQFLSVLSDYLKQLPHIHSLLSIKL